MCLLVSAVTPPSLCLPCECTHVQVSECLNDAVFCRRHQEHNKYRHKPKILLMDNLISQTLQQGQSLRFSRSSLDKKYRCEHIECTVSNLADILLPKVLVAHAHVFEIIISGNNLIHTGQTLSLQ